MSTLQEHIAEQAAVGVFAPEAVVSGEWYGEAANGVGIVDAPFDFTPVCPWATADDEVTGVVRAFFPRGYLQSVCNGKRAMLTEAK